MKVTFALHKVVDLTPKHTWNYNPNHILLLLPSMEIPHVRLFTVWTDYVLDSNSLSLCLLGTLIAYYSDDHCPNRLHLYIGQAGGGQRQSMRKYYKLIN